MKGLVVKNKALGVSDQLDIPTPKKGEVLIKVKYSSIHSFDSDNIAGKNDALGKFMGAKQSSVKTGIEFSGVVETNGARFKRGDNVFGYPDLVKGLKSHQEFITINEDLIASMPSTLDFAESAAIPVGALTSLAALEQVGKISKNSNVLINGAAGGLGVYAIQLAKIFDANVTAVAGPNQEEFLKELGANKVVNYKETSLKEIEDTFDIFLDLSAKLNYSSIKSMLKPKGVFVPADPFAHLLPMSANLFRSKKVGCLLVSKGNNEQLTRIAKWVDEGKLKPIVDKSYSFDEYEKGFERVMEKNKRGRILLEINS